MDPDLRNALLICGLVFLGLLTYATLAVAVRDGFDVLTVISLAVIWMIGSGVIGALRNRPK
jgi:hypothetical protein